MQSCIQFPRNLQGLLREFHWGTTKNMYTLHDTKIVVTNIPYMVIFKNIAASRTRYSCGSWARVWVVLVSVGALYVLQTYICSYF